MSEQRIFLRSGYGMLVVAAAVASLTGQISIPSKARKKKRMRLRLEADRSGKQYLLKGIRP